MQHERLLLLLVLLRRDAKVRRRRIKGGGCYEGLLRLTSMCRCTQCATFEKRLKTPKTHDFASTTMLLIEGLVISSISETANLRCGCP